MLAPRTSKSPTMVLLPVVVTRGMLWVRVEREAHVLKEGLQAVMDATVGPVPVVFDKC